jgi:syntaxin-binding protein 1
MPGSTHALTPRQFVDDLKVLEINGVGSHAAPNGLRDFRGPRPYQAFYDERYFTREAPLPRQQQQQTQRAPPLTKSTSSRSVPGASATASTISVNSSYAPTNGKEKGGKDDKKRRFLRF